MITEICVHYWLRRGRVNADFGEGSIPHDRRIVPGFPSSGRKSKNTNSVSIGDPRIRLLVVGGNVTLV
jgi:hypothetical protein